MKSRNLIIAVVLSGILLISWNYLFPPPVPPPAENNATVAEANATADSAKQSAPIPDHIESGASSVFDLPGQQTQEPAGATVTVETDLYSAEFSAAGATLQNFYLKKYKATNDPDSPLMNLVGNPSRPFGVLGLLLNGQGTWKEAVWTFEGEKDLKLAAGQNGTLIFRTTINDVPLERELQFSADNYLIKETVRLKNVDADEAAQIRLGITVSAPPLGHEEENKYDVTNVAYYTAAHSLVEEKKSESLENGLTAGQEGLLWGGIDSNYFLLGIAPSTTDNIIRARYEQDVFRVAMEKSGLESQNDTAAYSFTYYLGPKERAALELAPNDMVEAINFGIFSIIAKPLMWALKFFYSFVGNYGLAIIILTICVRILFFPLSQKSYKSMNQLKKLQPLMQKIKEQYKDDRRKMNEEVMNLYKTYKVNPAGGCVPMLVQIPVFIGLYQGLLHSIELRHAIFIEYIPFTHILWLSDLSAKDPYYITPILMGLSMFAQQRMTPAPADPIQAKVMLFLPLIFTFLFMNFPSGLVVYWLVSNLLGIAQQWWMLRTSDSKELVPVGGKAREAKIVKAQSKPEAKSKAKTGKPKDGRKK